MLAVYCSVLLMWPVLIVPHMQHAKVKAGRLRHLRGAVLAILQRSALLD